MHFSEAGRHQKAWQDARGMNEELNGRCNLDRIQVEIDEARAEPDPLLLLGELVDVLIISVAGAAMACEDAGVPVEELDNLILAKLALNDEKYPEHERDCFGDTQTYVDSMRSRWAEMVGRVEE